MASPAVRSILGKSKLSLPHLIRGTALTSQRSIAEVGTALVEDPIFCCSEEVVLHPPPQSSVFIGKKSLLGGGKAWALAGIGGVSAGVGSLRLAGRRPAVHDEDDDCEEMEEDDWDESDADDDLKDLKDSEDFDHDEGSEDDEDDMPSRKSK